VPRFCAVLEPEWLNLVLEYIWKSHDSPFLCGHVANILNRRFIVLASKYSLEPVVAILRIRNTGQIV
jgi:hypothetical protein